MSAKCRFGDLPIIGRHACHAIAVVRILVIEQGTYPLCEKHFGAVTGLRLKTMK
jgi:hypothetical protein